MMTEDEADECARLILAYRDYQVEVNGVDPALFREDFDRRITDATRHRRTRTLRSGRRSVLDTVQSCRGSDEREIIVSFLSARANVPRERFLAPRRTARRDGAA